MRIGILSVVSVGLLTAACGTDTQQRAATGGLTGLGIGALAGGPVGAIIGTAVGAGGGWAMPEGADTLALNAIGKEHQVASTSLNQAGLGPQAQAGQSGAQAKSQSSAQVRQAQTELKSEGFYNGPIDGIAGPKTRQAVASYQQREGLQQTARLDDQTLQHMNLGGGAAMSGSSTPPAAMSADDIRNNLQSQGYTNVSDLQRQSDKTYTAQADRGNDSYRLRVDARSGHVLSQQLASDHGANPQQAGSSTSTSTKSQ